LIISAAIAEWFGVEMTFAHVVAQRGHHDIDVHAGPFGHRRGLQTVLELRDLHALDEPVRGLQHREDPVRHVLDVAIDLALQ